MVRRQRVFSQLSTNYCLVFCLFTSLIQCACSQEVRTLSASDQRLPNVAKQRIADAEDAVLISRSQYEDAQSKYESALLKSNKFNQKPPNLGQATSLAKKLHAAQLNLRSLETHYAEVDYELSKSRLELVYAQTALRYDLAVYNLDPLTKSVDRWRAALLKLRKEKKQATAQMKDLVDQWWSSYQNFAKSTGTQAFWVHEFAR